MKPTCYSPILAFILMLISSHLAWSQEVIPLWPEGIPCESQNEIRIEDDERIGRKISRVHTPEMVMYKPMSYQSNGTSVVICPGGGYTILAWDWEGVEMARWFNSMGITAFVLKYRLPRWESEECRDKVALMDAHRAIQMIRSRAGEWGVNPDRVGIMGFSAGGHLASTALTHFDYGTTSSNVIEQQSSRPDFGILMYPVVTLDTAIAHSGSRTNLLGPNPSQIAVDHFSNEKQVSPETPPTILFHSNDDKGVVPENSVHFYLALRKHGVPAELHIYESGAHGFAMAKTKSGGVTRWPETCKAWLQGRGLLNK